MSRERRLFVASWPDETTRAAIVRTARRALTGANGRPVDPAGLHVTLAFLGGVAAERVPDIEAALGRVRGRAFDYRFDRIEVWPGPRVLALTTEQPNAAALTLVARIRTALAPLGFDPEPRPHLAHVTLARKTIAGPPPLVLEPLVWPVRALVLVESTPGPAGARYTPLASFDLVG
jgi:2'-5' RNA ligase